MRLAEFITTHQEAILQEFEDFARTSTAEGETMNVAALRDHAAAMLEEVALDLRQPQTAAAQKRKSEGDAPTDPTAPTTAAESHGHDRKASGNFTLNETVAELRALRASVLRLWAQAAGAPSDEDTVQDMMRFNEAIDQALTESITHFSLEHEKVRRARVSAEARRRIAEKADQLKSDLLRMVSHELRTPLNAMSGLTFNLLRGVHGAVPEEQQGVLVRIDKSGQRLRRIIDDLLDAKGIAEGSIDFQMGDLAVSELLTELQPLVEPLAQEANVELSIEMGGGDVVVRADPDKLYQVLLNLVSNAIWFSPHGGRVSLTCEESDAEVSVCVHDNGRGIPEDKLETIFEPFVQLDGGTTRERGGNGLGLTISRKFIRGMGGDLSVRSKPGKGSVFCINLPKNGQEPGRVENPEH